MLVYLCIQLCSYIYMPLQNMQNVNHFIKFTCYCLFNTVLNKLFHITDVFIFSTRQNNNWIYKKWPVQKFTYPWILTEQFCCSSGKKTSSCTFFGFPAFSAYLNPFQQWLYEFEIHLFTWKTIGGLMHNYYIMWKHLLMIKKAPQCINSWGVQTVLNWMIRVNCTFQVCKNDEIVQHHFLTI